MNPEHPHPDRSSSNSLVEHVRKILETADGPVDLKTVKTAVLKFYPKGTRKAPQPPQPTEPEIQAVLDGPGVHRYPPPTAKGKPKYWHKPPPPPPDPVELMRRTVLSKLESLGDGPFTASNLGKPTAKQGAVAAQAFEKIIAELKEQKKLFDLPGGKFGKKEPPKPKWYQSSPHKTEFDKCEKAAKKLQEQGVTKEEILSVLRERLGLVESKPEPKPESPPPVTKDLRTVLRQAYDDLCLLIDFPDRLVELRRLFHEAVKRMPSLTVEQFHRELWQMRSEWLIELHDLNEVDQAKEPHLAIHRDDRLYYFARWK